jgi:hypothetical protein
MPGVLIAHTQSHVGAVQQMPHYHDRKPSAAFGRTLRLTTRNIALHCWCAAHHLLAWRPSHRSWGCVRVYIEAIFLPVPREGYGQDAIQPHWSLLELHRVFLKPSPDPEATGSRNFEALRLEVFKKPDIVPAPRSRRFLHDHFFFCCQGS